MGWILGFRQLTYDLTTASTISEEFSNLNGTKYLYLAIDEFSKGNQYSFLGPLVMRLDKQLSEIVNRRLVSLS